MLRMTKKASDEKILIPVKYPEYADNLMSLAFLVRNQKLNRGLGLPQRGI